MKYFYGLLIISTVFMASTLLHASSSIEDALSSPGRTAEDLKSDQNRKPAQLLKFADIAPGSQVLDLFSGAGYYTEILSNLVGKDGKVVSHNNDAYLKYLGDRATQRYRNNRLSNVENIVSEANDLDFKDGQFDTIFMILTIHDFYHSSKYWPAINTDKVLSELYHSLKPGGSVIVVDHIGPDGDTTYNSEKLHRVFPSQVMKDMKKAGFKFVTEADFLKNPDDPLTIPMADQSIRGNTSRFVYKFTRS